MALGFGLFELQVPKFKTDAVRFFQLWLAGILADEGLDGVHTLR